MALHGSRKIELNVVRCFGSSSLLIAFVPFCADYVSERSSLRSRDAEVCFAPNHAVRISLNALAPDQRQENRHRDKGKDDDIENISGTNPAPTTDKYFLTNEADPDDGHEKLPVESGTDGER